MKQPTFQHIKVFDNFLTQEEFEQCEQMLLRPMWERTNSNAALGVECLMWRMNLTQDKFFSKTIFNKIQKTLGKKYEIFGKLSGQDKPYS